MPRPLVALVALVLLLPLPVLAQEASSVASPIVAPAGVRLDLPALVLQPSQLPRPGYQLENAFFEPTVEDRAEAVVSGPNVPATEVTTLIERLRDAGFQTFYVAYLGLPGPMADTPQREIAAYIETYVNAAGAEASFTATEDASVAFYSPTPQIVPGTGPIGERAELLRFTTNATGTPTPGAPPALGLDLEFRLGALNAGVTIFDETGATPEVAEVEALAAQLQANIEAALAKGEPG